MFISNDYQGNRCSDPLECTDYEKCLKYTSGPWTANKQQKNNEKR